jgi:hypothetical protein
MLDPATLPPQVHNFGFWLVDNDIVFSKVKSVLAAQQKNTNNIRFYYHDHTFNRIDWTIEPAQTLTELYKERALQLRENYDHVVLLYSGGSDSSNALKTFINNDIKLDEVFCWYTSHNEHNNLTNLEIIHSASGMLEKIQGLGIKVTKIDENPYFDKTDLKNPEWTLSAEPNLVSAQINKLKIFQENKSWRTLADSGKKIAIILGLEKPRIFYDSGKWVSAFLDVSNAWNWEELHTLPQSFTLEPFYISPHSPLITIKQSHIVKNYINKIYSVDFINDNFSKHRFNQELYYTIVRNTCYPYWDDNTFSIGKDVPVLKEKYRWVWDSNTQLSQDYFSGLHWVEKNIDSQFFNGGKIYNGLVGSWSRWYNLDA